MNTVPGLVAESVRLAGESYKDTEEFSAALSTAQDILQRRYALFERMAEESFITEAALLKVADSIKVNYEDQDTAHCVYVQELLLNGWHNGRWCKGEQDPTLGVTGGGHRMFDRGNKCPRSERGTV